MIEGLEIIIGVITAIAIGLVIIQAGDTIAEAIFRKVLCSATPSKA